MRKLLLVVIVAVATGVASAFPASAAPGSAPPDAPALVNWPLAFAQSVITPDASPRGSNDWNCKPPAAHPNPVVLVHGTWENALSTYSAIAPALKGVGFCVFALNFGKSNPLEQGGPLSLLPGAYGARPIEQSALELAHFVEQVRMATGAAQVDLIGHSQGGLVARQYMKFDGGAGKVRKLVTIAATNHGTSMDGLGTLDRIIRDQARINLDPFLDWTVGVSGVQQIYDSPFLRRLNAGGDTIPGVDYTVIASMYDEVSTPYWWTFLKAGPGAIVHNITLQDGCHQDYSEHLSIDYSVRTIDLVTNALDPALAKHPRCVFNFPLFSTSPSRPATPALSANKG